MRLHTRLLLPLLGTVTIVMALYATWALRQREAALLTEDRREAVVFASALALALEAALVDPEWRGVQDVVERLTQDPQIHGVRVYDAAGRVAFESSNLRGQPSAATDVLAMVVERGDTLAFERDLEDARMQVLLRPLRGQEGEPIGAFELTLGLSFVEAEIARTSTRFLLNTATLILALTVLTLWLVRRQIGEPLERLVAGVQAVGAGELQFRMPEDPRASDLAVVAREFNRMAARLEGAREDLLREADERVELERRLRETDKLAAAGKLAAGLAHEIATPLQIIKGRTDMLEVDAVGPEAYARNVRIIGEQIDRVTSLVRSLLNLARRPELRSRRLEVGKLIEGVVDLVETESDRCAIRLSLEPAPPAWVDGDPDLLHQALTNVLLNAIQALEHHGGRERSITVRTRVVRGSHSRADRAATRDTIRVEVEDTGPGIAPDSITRVFEPFYSTKSDSRGTGLGLSVAQSIVGEHGGSIEAENVWHEDRAGQAHIAGARFSIELPLALDAAAGHG